MCTTLGLIKEKRSIDESITNYKNKLNRIINDGHMTTWYSNCERHDGADTITEAINHLQNESNRLAAEISKRQNYVVKILSIFI